MTDTATNPAHHHGEPDEQPVEPKSLEQQILDMENDLDALRFQRRCILLSQADFQPPSS